MDKFHLGNGVKIITYNINDHVAIVIPSVIAKFIWGTEVEQEIHQIIRDIIYNNEQEFHQFMLDMDGDTDENDDEEEQEYPDDPFTL